MFSLIRPVLLACLFLAVSSACRNQGSRDTSRVEPEKIAPRDTAGLIPLPRLLVEEGNHQDLGKIREGIRTEVTFTLINKGPGDAYNINIDDLSQGGCTAVSVVSELPAGDTAQLVFLFETLGYGGRKETRKVVVRYDNPGLSPMTLSVTAEVLPVKPYQVPIGELYYNFFMLLDIRDEEAFREGHIAGAIHIPRGEVLSWADSLPRDFMIYLCSEDGAQSDSLAKQMQSRGYTHALSIVGGIREWKRMYGERVIIKGAR